MINRYKTYWTKKALTGVFSLLTLLSSCSDDIVSDTEEEIPAPFGYINVGASLGDPEITTRATEVPNKTGHYYAETVEWLKGALKAGVDITYSNIDADGNRMCLRVPAIDPQVARQRGNVHHIRNDRAVLQRSAIAAQDDR